MLSVLHFSVQRPNALIYHSTPTPQHFTNISLQYRRTDDNAWAYFFAEKIPSDAKSFVMRNLDPDSAYHIKLAAKNEFGMGEFDQYHAAVGSMEDFLGNTVWLKVIYF